MLFTQQATKLFHCTNRPVGSTHLLYSAAFRTLAAPTKKSTTPNPITTSSARLQLISRQFSTSTSNISSSLNMSPRYTVRKVGPANTLEHRIYIEKDGVPVSPFHDIPLYANDQQTTLNMIVEIPRWTNGKLEVCRASCTRPMGQLTSKMRRGFLQELTIVRIDLERGRAQSYQARYQERQTPLCPQLLSSQRLSLELRCLPTSE